jgi:hypothetical protein
VLRIGNQLRIIRFGASNIEETIMQLRLEKKRIIQGGFTCWYLPENSMRVL